MEGLRTIAQRGLVGLGAVLALGFLFWNPAPETPDDGRTHIRYWYMVGADDTVPYHARRFNEVQDDIVVHATPIPWTEHEKKILTAILSGDPPDVVSQFIPVPKWASRLALTPLDGFLEATDFDTTAFFPALWSEMRWQGRLFAVPVNSTSYGLFYNKDLFHAAGLDPEAPPQTWADLEAAAQRLTERDANGRITQAGFVPDYGTLPTTQLMVWQQGGQFLSPDGQTVQLDTPEAREAVRWMADYYRAYGVDALKTFTAGLGTAEQHGFLSGKLGLAILDFSFVHQLARYAPGLDYGVAPIPTFPGRPTASSAGSWWLGIPRGARHAEAAWAFLQFATAHQTQLEEALAAPEPLLPSHRLAAEDSAFVSTDDLRTLVAQLEVARSPAVVPLAHDVFWREFVSAQERAVFGLQTPEAALAQAERVVQDALDRARAYDDYVRARVDLDALDGAGG